MKEEWKISLPMSFKDKAIRTRINEEFLGFMVRETNDEHYIYIYEITSSRYLGFINLA